MFAAKEYREEKEFVLSYRAVRAFIGWVGFALPIILIGVGALVATVKGGMYRWEDSGIVQTSLSDYHGSQMRNLFVGLLAGMGVFLLAYRGHSNHDNGMSSVAGAMALLVAIFPDDCDAPAEGICKMDTFAGPLGDVPFISSGQIHFTAAFILFALMGIMSFFQFTRTKAKKSHADVNKGDTYIPWRKSDDISVGKWRRNIAYWTCGAVIWASIIFVAADKVLHFAGEFGLLIGEVIMVFAFGFAWQLKGEVGAHVTKPWAACLFRPYKAFFWAGD